MANSFISSLETLDPTSVNNVSSLFFYLSNNGANRLISGKTMESYLCNRNSTIVVRTSDYSITGATNTLITWEHAIRDPLGLFDPNSAQALFFNFDGYVQLKGSAASKTGAGTYFRRQFYINSLNEIPGSGAQGWREFATAYSWQIMTGPVAVTSGDYVGLNVQYQATNTGNAVNGGTWIECVPLQVFK